MLRRRIEKLEANWPELPGKLMDRLDRQALNALCPRNRELVTEIFRTNGRRKAWSPEHLAAMERYDESFGQLLQDVSDEDLSGLIANIECEYGKPIHEVVGVA
jgi:hypothetical protein